MLLIHMQRTKINLIFETLKTLIDLKKDSLLKSMNNTWVWDALKCY